MSILEAGRGEDGRESTFVGFQSRQATREVVKRGPAGGGRGQHDQPDVLQEERGRNSSGEFIEEVENL